jgi:hypothetical protein
MGDAEVCVAAAETAIPYTGAGIELGPQCRQNSTGTLLSVSACADLPPSTRDRVLLELTRLGECCGHHLSLSLSLSLSLFLCDCVWYQILHIYNISI